MLMTPWFRTLTDRMARRDVKKASRRRRERTLLGNRGEMLEVRTLLAAADFLNLTQSLFVTEADAGGVNEAGDEFAAAVTVGDFNADGFTDLVVGAPAKNGGAGTISIFHGSEAGLLPGTGITIDQTAAGGTDAPGDQFGAALTVGDFNGDLVNDLAVGAPGETVGAVTSGAVYVFLGQDGVGLTTGFVLTQEDAGGASADGDRFGAALATGDFHGHLFINGLSLEDLAVGAPGKDGGAGSVYVFTASEAAPLTTGTFFTQADFSGDHVAGDQFGAALESGHFDGFTANVDVGNGFADLAVGSPGEDTDTGTVYTFYGLINGSGLDITTPHVLTQALAGGTDVVGDRFGASLGVGDANNDGVEELAAGAPGKAVGAGAVAVFLGTGDGFTAGGFILTQENAGGVSEAGDEFGADVVFGVLDQNNAEELVVGAPGDAPVALGPKSGAAYVFGGVDLLVSLDVLAPGFMITQADAGGVSAAGDRFGHALAIEDFNDNNAADLAVGAPMYAPSAGVTSGAAFVFPGVPISPPRTTQAEAGGVNEAGDEFGAAQVTGDFNGDGLDDLAVGAPGKTLDGMISAGAVSIYTGTDAVEGGVTDGFFITQTDAGGANDAGDRFGAALTVGDFNDDGYDDLAVGTPGETVSEAGTNVVTFQQGISGYSGTVDTSLAMSTPNADRSSATKLRVDLRENGGPLQGLLRFDDIFGSALGQIPENSEIVSATLEVRVTDSGDPLLLHRMLQDWSDTDTWNTLNAGIQADDVEAASSVDASTDRARSGRVLSIDVTSSLQAWQSEVSTNYGWALLSTGIDGVVFYSAEGASAPRLSIEFIPVDGPVYMFYGSADGLTEGFAIDVGGVNGPDDQFGAALTSGDFNGDLVDDLAVGAPGEGGSGAVYVLSGSNPDGLLTPPGLMLTQTDAGELNEADDQFGAVLTAWDFNGDLVDDLVVGAPGKSGSGAVFVYSGSSPVGLLATPGFMMTQTDAGEVNEMDDQFGAALAVGDFNADGLNDLAVGAPGEDMSGAVSIFSGSDVGIPTGYLITQPEIGGEIQFGAALVAADLTADGFDDLVVGAPGKDGSGAIFIMPGSEIGLSLAYMGTQKGSGGANEVGDLFGASLTEGDFDGDGLSDLGVGAPGEAPALDPISGAIYIYPNGEVLAVLEETLPTHHGQIRPFLNLEASYVVSNSGALPVTDPQTVTFQQGISGYSGTVDTYVQTALPNSSKATAPILRADLLQNGGPIQGLLRFDNIFGSDVGQVPEDGQIQSARLEVWVTNSGDPLGLHRMLQDWSDTDTWNTLDAGIQADDMEAVSTADVTTARLRSGRWLSIDVTSSVEVWQSDVSSNFGWALLPTGDDGVEFTSAQGTKKPRLIIDYVPVVEETVVAHGEFNGDGFGDLAVAYSDSISIYYGAEEGLTTSFAIDQTLAGEVNEPGDLFGASMINLDLNTDGFGDLVVGAPGDALGADPNSGAIYLFYGSATGFTAAGIMTQIDAGGVNEAGDLFGAALNSGDYNDDGFEDLAVGAPGKLGSGAVYVFYQTSLGVFSPGYVLTQTDAGGVNEAGDEFGAALAGGDCTIEGFDELIVGAPGKTVDGVRSGAVYVFTGSDEVRRELPDAVPLFALPPLDFPDVHSNLGLLTGFMITQTDAGGVNEEGDRFGADLAAGDMNGDESEEVVIGAPGKNGESGVVYLFQGQSVTLDAVPIVLPPLKETVVVLPGVVITQEDAGQSSEAGDGFGAVLTMGFLNEDLLKDLIVGAPGKDGGSGALFVFPASEQYLTNGLMITPSQVGGASFMASIDTDDVNDDNGAELVVAGPGGTAYIIPGVALAPSNVTQTNAGDVNEAGDLFGAAMSAGDFNGNSTDDLAVGAPGKNGGSGAVYIFTGSAGTPAHPTTLGITSGVLLAAGNPGAQLGAAVVAGDFNADGFEDLAAGAPGEGVVYVFYGSDAGLADPPEVVTFVGVVAGDEFGAVLTAGDFNGDSFDDLAVGAPGEGGSGAVHIFDGSLDAATLGLTAGSVLTQSDAGGADEAGDRFGAALDAGDIDGDLSDDLAVGVPGEDGLTGAVAVFTTGLTTGFVLTQSDADAAEANEAGDRFGAAVALGDTNFDGFKDLAVGAPGENADAGNVAIFHGAAGGIVPGTTTSYIVTQELTEGGMALGTTFYLETSEAGDQFGAALTFGDFDADGNEDLVVGAPGEALELAPASGAIFVFRGTSDGIKITFAPGDIVSDTNFFYSQDGFGGMNEAGDQYGSAFVAGNFNGAPEGFMDLAVGAPLEAPALDPASGAVYLIPAIELGA